MATTTDPRLEEMQKRGFSQREINRAMGIFARQEREAAERESQRPRTQLEGFRADRDRMATQRALASGAAPPRINDELTPTERRLEDFREAQATQAELNKKRRGASVTVRQAHELNQIRRALAARQESGPTIEPIDPDKVAEAQSQLTPLTEDQLKQNRQRRQAFRERPDVQERRFKKQQRTKELDRMLTERGIARRPADRQAELLQLPAVRRRMGLSENPLSRQAISVFDLDSVEQGEFADGQIITDEQGRIGRFNDIDGSVTPMIVDPNTGQPVIDAQSITANVYADHVTDQELAQVRQAAEEHATPRIHRELARIESERVKIQSDESLSEDEREQLLDELRSEEARTLYPVAVRSTQDPKAAQQKTQQEFESETVTLSDGTVIGRDRNGAWREVYRPDDEDAPKQRPATFHDWYKSEEGQERAAKVRESLIKAATDSVSDGGSRAIELDQVAEKLVEILQAEWDAIEKREADRLKAIEEQEAQDREAVRLDPEGTRTIPEGAQAFAPDQPGATLDQPTAEQLVSFVVQEMGVTDPVQVRRISRQLAIDLGWNIP